MSHTQSASGQSVALTGGVVYVSPTEDAIQDGVVVIQDGRVTAVGPRASVLIPVGVETLDCSGLTVAAGFWNSHVHFMGRKWADVATIPASELTGQLEDMLTRFGFTSVWDTGSMWENTRQLRDRVDAGEIPGPRIRSTGEVLTPVGGAAPDLILDVKGAMRIRTPEVAGASEAAEAATKLLDAGVDAIKLYAATWAPPIVTLPEGVIDAAVDEAHRRGRPVFAHPSNRLGLMAAVVGGVDILVHTAPQAGPRDGTIVMAMKRADVALIPTLQLWRYELRHDRVSVRERFVATAVEQLRTRLAAGGVVLFGTDVGYMDDYDPTEEYELTAEAGMDFRQILAALTTAPAERFGESGERGRIAIGLAGDLTVMEDDPARDVRVFAAVRYAIRGGRVIYRADR